MTLPILTTKLHHSAPPPTLVPRTRLRDKIEAGRRGKLILISAPAGFGKTTLLADWVTNCKGKRLISWVHLDNSDNELVRFLNYVIAALQRHNKDLGEAALAGLNSIPPAPIEGVLTSLLNEMDAIPGVLYLILDDYHLVDNADIHEAMLFMIDNLPIHSCLVISTRSDPPFPLHRWRAHGQLTEIRSEHLRFSSQETRIYLEETIGYNFSSDEIEALDSRIEGWIAGLQMLSLSMRGKSDPQGFINNFSVSHRYLMDYLSEEIFEHQHPSIQDFLLRTSFLDTLCGPLCDFVLTTGKPPLERMDSPRPAKTILQQLESENLFLMPMDEERHWYRYHRLFANMLRQRMRQTRPNDIPGILQRASAWSAANGQISEAINYALEGEDTRGAALLVEQNAYSLLKRGAIKSLSVWLEKLDEEIILESPWLCVYKSWVLLLSGHLENLDEYLNTAELKQPVGTDGNDVRGHIAAIRAYSTSMQGKTDLALAYTQEATDLLPADNLTVRSVVMFVLGGIQMMRQMLPQALESMKKAGEMGEKAGNVHLAVSAMGAAGDLLRLLGNSNDAERIYEKALRLAMGSSGRPLPLAARIYSSLAELNLAQENGKSARQMVETGLELAKQWGNIDSLARCYLTQAELALQSGNLSQAQEGLTEAKHLASTHTLTPGFDERIRAIEKASQKAQSDQPALIDPLTERELEVLRLMITGCSNKEIGERLIISLGTVKAHTSSIYRKLDVRSRAQAVIKAREFGLG